MAAAVEVMWASYVPLHAPARIGKVHLREPGEWVTLCGVRIPGRESKNFTSMIGPNDDRCKRCAKASPVVAYGIGDVIEYTTITGRIRTVRVTGRDKEGGYGVFDGIVVEGEPEAGTEVWGWDASITRVIEKAS